MTTLERIALSDLNVNSESLLILNDGKVYFLTGAELPNDMEPEDIRAVLSLSGVGVGDAGVYVGPFGTYYVEYSSGGLIIV